MIAGVVALLLITISLVSAQEQQAYWNRLLGNGDYCTYYAGDDGWSLRQWWVENIEDGDYYIFGTRYRATYWHTHDGDPYYLATNHY